MPRPKSKHTDLWAEHLRAELARRDKLPPGDGWLTRHEIKNLACMGETASVNYIRKGLDDGSIEQFSGFVMDGKQARRRVWYRPVMK